MKPEPLEPTCPSGGRCAGVDESPVDASAPPTRTALGRNDAARSDQPSTGEPVPTVVSPRERRSRAVARALVACVREHPADAAVPELAAHVEQYGIAAVHQAAHRHAVVGCLWTALRGTGLSERDDARAVRDEYRGNVGRYLRTLSDLELADEVLGAAGAAYLVVKGPVLAEQVYRRPDLRSAVDLDLVVSPRDFPLALSSLQEAGCLLYEADWAFALAKMPGSLRLFTPAGTVLDLHWSLFAEPAVRTAFPLGVEALMRRSRTVVLAGRSVRTLDDVDMVVHLALHASLAGGHRLVWLKDLEQALLRGRQEGWLDWDVLARRAEQCNAGPALALMLARTRAVLGAEVPGAVLRGLAPDARWRTITRLADRLAPVPLVGDGPSPAWLVARSVRGDGRASRRELRRHGVAAWLRHDGIRLGGPKGGRPMAGSSAGTRRGTAVATPAEVAGPAGSAGSGAADVATPASAEATARAAYLAAVCQHTTP